MIFKCRCVDSNATDWIKIDALDPEHAVEIFAEDLGLEQDDIVEVEGEGLYEIFIDVEYSAEPYTVY